MTCSPLSAAHRLTRLSVLLTVLLSSTVAAMGQATPPCPPTAPCIPVVAARLPKTARPTTVPSASVQPQPAPPAQPSQPTQRTEGTQRAYERVFVLGNSITSINVPESIRTTYGWTGNWGMAASAPANDYFHLLSQRLQQRNPKVQINTISGGGFERDFDVYNIEQSLNEHITNRPDLIIVRIAENINDPSVLATDKARSFETAYNQLIDYLLSRAAPNVRVICTTSFWNHPNANAVIRRVAGQRGFAVADLSVLYGNPDYMANEFRSVNPAVADHPNDRGMARIAYLIWEQVQ